MKNYKLSLGAIILIMMILFSCEKAKINKSEEPEQTCNCYEQHEKAQGGQMPNGSIGIVWVLDYNTTTIGTDCSMATDLIWTDNGTKRYKVICE